MVADNLSHNTEYLIVILYSSDTTGFLEKTRQECLAATMQVKIANSKSDFVCLNKRLSHLKSKHEAQSYPFTLSYKTAAEKGKHMQMVAKQFGNRSEVKAANYEIEIKDEDTDLEVTVEGSDHLYGSKIVIVPSTTDFDSKREEDGRGMHKLLGDVFGAKNTLVPDIITSPKHMTKYVFRNVAPGAYRVKLL